MDDEKQQKNEKRWKKFQEMQGYTDEEMVLFRSNPRYVKAMERAPKFSTHKIIAEIVESHNCIAGHKEGDKFVLTGNGFVIADESPKYMCIQALAALPPYISAMWERFYEDLDPDQMFYNTVHCPDVGCKRGGWGEVVMRVYAIPSTSKPGIKGDTL